MVEHQEMMPWMQKPLPASPGARRAYVALSRLFTIGPTPDERARARALYSYLSEQRQSELPLMPKA